MNGAPKPPPPGKFMMAVVESRRWKLEAAYIHPYLDPRPYYGLRAHPDIEEIGGKSMLWRGGCLKTRMNEGFSFRNTISRVRGS